jgi:hypothetical protein
LIEKDITVTNPVSCPSDRAFLIADAAYEPKNGIDQADAPGTGTEFPGTWENYYNTKFRQIGDLCVYRTDVSAGTLNWSANACYPNGWQDGNTEPGVWRMPNVMELAGHMRKVGCSACQTYGLLPTGTHRFFSSTENSNGPSTSFIEVYSTGPTWVGIQAATKSGVSDAHVRCVKTIPY